MLNSSELIVRSGPPTVVLMPWHVTGSSVGNAPEVAKNPSSSGLFEHYSFVV